MSDTKNHRKKEILAGVLYISGFIAGLLSIAPSIDASDYLIQASANTNQVLFGALLQFIMSIAFVSFAIILYPFLKKSNECLAIGFLSFRIIAAILNIIGFIFLLLLLKLSQQFIKADISNLSYFQDIGDLLRTGRDYVNHVAMIITSSIGGIFLYLLFLQSRIFPRFLSYFGLLGVIFTVFASFLVMFNAINIITPMYILLNLPLAFLELVLAIWLITKGLDLRYIKL